MSLSGENGFGLRVELNQLTAAFVAEHGDIAVERLDGEDVGLERLQESLQSPPFLSARKLVVLRAPGSNKQFVEHVETLLKELPETTDVIIVEPKLDKRSVYYKLLQKQTDLKMFSALDEQGLARWVSEAVDEQGGRLSTTDARYLVTRVGTNQQLIAGEIAKLLIYNPQISHETIDLLVEATPQSKIFDLLEGAFAGNAARALELYRDQRAQKVDSSQIVAMITWQLRILALLMTAGQRTPGDLAVEAKLSPYTIQKSQAIVRRLSLQRLKQLITDLLLIDMRSKREGIDVDEALQNYLLMLSA